MSLGMRSVTPVEGFRGAELDSHLLFALRGYEVAQAALDAAANDSLTYRVAVGAAALFHNVRDDRLHVVTAANVKLWQGGNRTGGVRTCAEEFLEQEEPYVRDPVVGLVVASTASGPEIESITDYPTPTLHSCEPCYTRFGERVEDGSLSSRLPLVTANPEGVHEFHVLGSFVDSYRNGGPDLNRRGIYDPGFAGWQERAANFIAAPNLEVPSIVAAHFIITGSLPSG